MEWLKDKVDSKTLEWCEKNQVQILNNQEIPRDLRAIYGSPRLLFLKGNAKAILNSSLAIVGARSASPYALACAFHFAREIAAQGWTVVSGLAKGVDAYSHRGALSVSGQTVAVFGSGFKKIYPSENRKLAFEILDKGGAWLTEYPPDAPPLPQHFPQRNRIISGLSKGTLVIEARKKSGSLITALNALEQGRGVFVIPGQIDQGLFEGSHHLIQQGAKLVYQLRDILEEVGNGSPVLTEKKMPVSFGEAFDLEKWTSHQEQEPFSRLQDAIQRGLVVQIAPHRYLCVQKESI